ncbi:magnesium chelatase [Pseudothauera nasutitermitis]|uniref:Magnesium chelatase n=1 Tax=Pseudothauera nasutitermitis TaxID=2565930 RepID=A0A4S4AX29_9RHOO|nr:ATP-binding protein [Pseudothauera nasutitermitis]THF64637.1 magnesium chelatase [Pseudothauera nasutitermitis]
MNDPLAAAPPAFPFSALHGQPLLRRALLLAAIDPLIGGVLVEGPRGTAKSTAARALAALLPGGYFVNLPLSASEEQLVGSLDLEAALRDGQVRFRPGLLARAHEGVLYVDEVNLLADGLVDLLLDVSASGINRIERDGISHAHPARIALVGTMNPEEGELRPQLLDRFGLFVRLEANLPPAEREAIVRTRLAFDADPAAFAARSAAAEGELAARIAGARARLAAIAFDDASHAEVAARCHAAAVEGVRADLVMLRAARAHAAFADRDHITAEDIDAVAELVLAHRRHADQAPTAEPPAQGGETPDAAPAPSRRDEDWGALPPQAVPTATVKPLRPLHAKKP